MENTSELKGRPYTVRFKTSIEDLISSLCQTKKKPSDFISEAVQSYASRLSQSQIETSELLANPREAILEIMQKKSDESRSFSIAQMSFFLKSWRNAYCFGSTGNHANPAYLNDILDIMKELMFEAKISGVPLDMEHNLNCFREHETTDLNSIFMRLKDEVSTYQNMGAADMFTRPLEELSDKLHLFNVESLIKVCTSDRIFRLLPVTIRGCKLTFDFEEIMLSFGKRSSNGGWVLMEKQNELIEFSVENIGFRFSGFPLYCQLTVKGSGGSSHFVFNAQRVIALMAAEGKIANGSAGDSVNFFSPKLDVNVLKSSVIIENEHAHRVELTKEVFERFIVKVGEIKNNNDWVESLKIHKLMLGDA